MEKIHHLLFRIRILSPILETIHSWNRIWVRIYEANNHGSDLIQIRNTAQKHTGIILSEILRILERKTAKN